MSTDNVTTLMGTDIYFQGDMKASISGDLALVSGLANLQQALFNRLITVPGSLVGSPNYGIGIRQWQNAPSTFAVQQKLASMIEEQFLRDPRIESVSSVAVNNDDANPRLTKIVVTLTPKGYTERQMTFMPFNGGDTGQ